MSGSHVGNESLPSVAAVIGLGREIEPFELRKLAAIKCRPSRALVDKPIQFSELHEPNGALQVGHAVIEAEMIEIRQNVGSGAVDGAPARTPMRRDCAESERDRLKRIGGGDHTALAGGNRFPRME